MSTESGSGASDSTMANQTADLPSTKNAIVGPGRSSTNAPIRDISSFEDLYRADYKNVVGLSFVLTGSRHVAEDTAQEAFTAAFRRWNSIAAYESPGAWVRRVACNHAVSAVRRRVREAKALLRLAGLAHAEIVLDEGDEAFWQAVRRLPARQAQAVALHYMEDMSVAQIAEVLDCSEGSVKTHLSRARQAVARDLQLENNDNG